MKRKVFTGEGNFHFITFSTYGGRNLLSTPRSRQIVISVLSKLAHEKRVYVSGFVIMPDHVHTILWFHPDDSDLPKVIQVWKSMSAHYLRTYYEETFPNLIKNLRTIRSGRDVICFWQRRYYDFNIKTIDKLEEKLNYIHENPVRKGLVKSAGEYKWSSAPWYFSGKSVGLEITPGF